jgi:drug/metabolite transporter (DMT)-like permease
VGVGLAFAGLVCMSSPGGWRLDMGLGEWLTVACAGVLAAQIVLIGHVAPGKDAHRLAFVQLVVAALFCLGGMAVFAEPLPAPSGMFVACALGLGAVSAFIQVAMNWAQKTVPPTRAAVLYALQPVWAGVIGYAIGERMSAIALVGAALILMSMVTPARERP